jgi:hypothetical protein
MELKTLWACLVRACRPDGPTTPRLRDRRDTHSLEEVVGRDGNPADEVRGGRALANDAPPVVPQRTPLTQSTGPVLAHRPSCVLRPAFSPGGAPCLTLAHAMALRPPPH